MVGSEAVTGARVDIGIEAADRQAIAEGLGRVLADTYTLSIKRRAFIRT